MAMVQGGEWGEGGVGLSEGGGAVPSRGERVGVGERAMAA